ncbi:MAG: peptidylprolyl isomerase [Patescibacteria group bacterium]
MKTGLIAIIVIIALGIAGYFFLNQKPRLTLATPSASPSTTMSTEPTRDLYTAVIHTAKGDITLALYAKVAPKTVANFVKLSEEGFYNGTKFHRVIANFMIQGGDPLSKTDDPNVGRGGPGYKFEDEINPRVLGVPENLIAQYEAGGYKYNYSLESMPVDVGAIAMANSGPATNGSQFFIVTTEPQTHLYGLHTVFGRVTAGMEIVRKIAQGDVVTSITIK